MLQWLNCGENVLLEVNQVKFKKDDGILYVTVQRIAWSNISNTATPSLYYDYPQIKAQRISPDSAPKVRLQLVLRDDSTVTFHFNNSVSERQKAERERVKELLVQLLQKHKKPVTNQEPSKKQISKELEMKQKILQSSEEMFIMYKTLVSGGIITAEDFWTIPLAEQLLSAEQNSQQAAGVTSAFMSEARPEVDGCNSVQYNLTSEIIQSIFHTYPMIKLKHQELVPEKMTEKEFWTKFFQSNYFHKDKAASSDAKHDVFTSLAQVDEETSLQKMLMAENNPLMEVASVDSLSTEDGFGLVQSSKAAGSKPLARKYNHHSFMICQNFREEGEGQEGSSSRRKFLKEATVQEDLVNPAAPHHAPLSLAKGTSGSAANIRITLSLEDTVERMERTKADIKQLTLGNMHRCIAPDVAFQAMTSLSSESSHGPKVPKPGSSTHELVRIAYLNASQILRHFWQCFPVTTPAQEEKMGRFAESIGKFKATTLQETCNKLPPKEMRLLKHLVDQLDLALNKFEQVKAKNGRR